MTIAAGVNCKACGTLVTCVGDSSDVELAGNCPFCGASATYALRADPAAEAFAEGVSDALAAGVEPTVPASEPVASEPATPPPESAPTGTP